MTVSMYMKVNPILLIMTMLLVSCTEKVQDGSSIQSDADILKTACFNVWSPGGRSGDNGAKGEDKELLQWSKAYVAVADCIKANDPDVIGLNEIGATAFSTKNETNIQSLLPAYSWVMYKQDGTPIKNTEEKNGIYTLTDVILYKSAVLTLLDKGIFWTTSVQAGSHGANVPESDPLFDLKAYDYASRGYIDMCNEQRHCVWAKFEHKLSGNKFYVFCLHNDLTYTYTDVNGQRIKNEQSQCANAQTVMHYAKSIVPADTPSLILGDFNATAGDTSFDLFRNDGRWKDAYETVAKREGNYKTSGVSITTMNGKDNNSLSTIRPDHILTDGFNVATYEVDRTKYKNTDGHDIYPSDHFLVKASVRF